LNLRLRFGYHVYGYVGCYRLRLRSLRWLRLPRFTFTVGRLRLRYVTFPFTFDLRLRYGCYVYTRYGCWFDSTFVVVVGLRYTRLHVYVYAVALFYGCCYRSGWTFGHGYTHTRYLYHTPVWLRVCYRVPTVVTHCVTTFGYGCCYGLRVVGWILHCPGSHRLRFPLVTGRFRLRYVGRFTFPVYGRLVTHGYRLVTVTLRCGRGLRYTLPAFCPHPFTLLVTIYVDLRYVCVVCYVRLPRYVALNVALVDFTFVTVVVRLFTFVRLLFYVYQFPLILRCCVDLIDSRLLLFGCCCSLLRCSIYGWFVYGWLPRTLHVTFTVPRSFGCYVPGRCCYVTLLRFWITYVCWITIYVVPGYGSDVYRLQLRSPRLPTLDSGWLRSRLHVLRLHVYARLHTRLRLRLLHTTFTLLLHGYRLRCVYTVVTVGYPDVDLRLVTFVTTRLRSHGRCYGWLIAGCPGCYVTVTRLRLVDCVPVWILPRLRFRFTVPGLRLVGWFPHSWIVIPVAVTFPTRITHTRRYVYFTGCVYVARLRLRLHTPHTHGCYVYVCRLRLRLRFVTFVVTVGYGYGYVTVTFTVTFGLGCCRSPRLVWFYVWLRLRLICCVTVTFDFTFTVTFTFTFTVVVGYVPWFYGPRLLICYVLHGYVVVDSPRYVYVYARSHGCSTFTVTFTFVTTFTVGCVWLRLRLRYVYVPVTLLRCWLLFTVTISFTLLRSRWLRWMLRLRSRCLLYVWFGLRLRLRLRYGCYGFPRLHVYVVVTRLFGCYVYTRLVPVWIPFTFTRLRYTVVTLLLVTFTFTLRYVYTLLPRCLPFVTLRLVAVTFGLRYVPVYVVTTVTFTHGLHCPCVVRWTFGWLRCCVTLVTVGWWFTVTLLRLLVVIRLPDFTLTFGYGCWLRYVTRFTVPVTFTTYITFTVVTLRLRLPVLPPRSYRCHTALTGLRSRLRFTFVTFPDFVPFGYTHALHVGSTRLRLVTVGLRLVYHVPFGWLDVTFATHLHTRLRLRLRCGCVHVVAAFTHICLFYAHVCGLHAVTLRLRTVYVAGLRLRYVAARSRYVYFTVLRYTHGYRLVTFPFVCWFTGRYVGCSFGWSGYHGYGYTVAHVPVGYVDYVYVTDVYVAFTLRYGCVDLRLQFGWYTFGRSPRCGLHGYVPVDLRLVVWLVTVTLLRLHLFDGSTLRFRLHDFTLRSRLHTFTFTLLICWFTPRWLRLLRCYVWFTPRLRLIYGYTRLRLRSLRLRLVTKVTFVTLIYVPHGLRLLRLLWSVDLLRLRLALVDVPRLRSRLRYGCYVYVTDVCLRLRLRYGCYVPVPVPHTRWLFTFPVDLIVVTLLLIGCCYRCYVTFAFVCLFCLRCCVYVCSFTLFDLHVVDPLIVTFTVVCSVTLLRFTIYVDSVPTLLLVVGCYYDGVVGVVTLIWFPFGGYGVAPTLHVLPLHTVLILPRLFFPPRCPHTFVYRLRLRLFTGLHAVAVALHTVVTTDPTVPGYVVTGYARLHATVYGPTPTFHDLRLDLQLLPTLLHTIWIHCWLYGRWLLVTGYTVAAHTRLFTGLHTLRLTFTIAVVGWFVTLRSLHVPVVYGPFTFILRLHVGGFTVTLVTLRTFVVVGYVYVYGYGYGWFTFTVDLHTLRFTDVGRYTFTLLRVTFTGYTLDVCLRWIYVTFPVVHGWLRSFALRFVHTRYIYVCCLRLHIRCSGWLSSPFTHLRLRLVPTPVTLRLDGLVGYHVPRSVHWLRSGYTRYVVTFTYGSRLFGCPFPVAPVTTHGWFTRYAFTHVRPVGYGYVGWFTFTFTTLRLPVTWTLLRWITGRYVIYVCYTYGLHTDVDHVGVYPPRSRSHGYVWVTRFTFGCGWLRWLVLLRWFWLVVPRFTLFTFPRLPHTLVTGRIPVARCTDGYAHLRSFTFGWLFTRLFYVCPVILRLLPTFTFVTLRSRWLTVTGLRCGLRWFAVDFVPDSPHGYHVVTVGCCPFYTRFTVTLFTVTTFTIYVPGCWTRCYVILHLITVDLRLHTFTHFVTVVVGLRYVTVYGTFVTFPAFTLRCDLLIRWLRCPVGRLRWLRLRLPVTLLVGGLFVVVRLYVSRLRFTHTIVTHCLTLRIYTVVLRFGYVPRSPVTRSGSPRVFPVWFTFTHVTLFDLPDRFVGYSLPRLRGYVVDLLFVTLRFRLRYVRLRWFTLRWFTVTHTFWFDLYAVTHVGYVPHTVDFTFVVVVDFTVTRWLFGCWYVVWTAFTFTVVTVDLVAGYVALPGYTFTLLRTTHFTFFTLLDICCCCYVVTVTHVVTFTRLIYTVTLLVTLIYPTRLRLFVYGCGSPVTFIYRLFGYVLHLRLRLRLRLRCGYVCYVTRLRCVYVPVPRTLVGLPTFTDVHVYVLRLLLRLRRLHTFTTRLRLRLRWLPVLHTRSLHGTTVPVWFTYVTRCTLVVTVTHGYVYGYVRLVTLRLVYGYVYVADVTVWLHRLHVTVYTFTLHGLLVAFTRLRSVTVCVVYTGLRTRTFTHTYCVYGCGCYVVHVYGCYVCVWLLLRLFTVTLLHTRLHGSGCSHVRTVGYVTTFGFTFTFYVPGYGLVTLLHRLIPRYVVPHTVRWSLVTVVCICSGYVYGLLRYVWLPVPFGLRLRWFSSRVTHVPVTGWVGWLRFAGSYAFYVYGSRLPFPHSTFYVYTRYRTVLHTWLPVPRWLRFTDTFDLPRLRVPGLRHTHTTRYTFTRGCYHVTRSLPISRLRLRLHVYVYVAVCCVCRLRYVWFTHVYGYVLLGCYILLVTLFTDPGYIPRSHRLDYGCLHTARTLLRLPRLRWFIYVVTFPVVTLFTLGYVYGRCVTVGFGWFTLVTFTRLRLFPVTTRLRWILDGSLRFTFMRFTFGWLRLICCYIYVYVVRCCYTRLLHVTLRFTDVLRFAVYTLHIRCYRLLRLRFTRFDLRCTRLHLRSVVTLPGYYTRLRSFTFVTRLRDLPGSFRWLHLFYIYGCLRFVTVTVYVYVVVTVTFTFTVTHVYGYTRLILRLRCYILHFAVYVWTLRLLRLHFTLLRSRPSVIHIRSHTLLRYHVPIYGWTVDLRRYVYVTFTFTVTFATTVVVRYDFPRWLHLRWFRFTLLRSHVYLTFTFPLTLPHYPDLFTFVYVTLLLFHVARSFVRFRCYVCQFCTRLRLRYVVPVVHLRLIYHGYIYVPHVWLRRCYTIYVYVTFHVYDLHTFTGCCWLRCYGYIDSLPVVDADVYMAFTTGYVGTLICWMVTHGCYGSRLRCCCYVVTFGYVVVTLRCWFPRLFRILRLDVYVGYVLPHVDLVTRFYAHVVTFTHPTDCLVVTYVVAPDVVTFYPHTHFATRLIWLVCCTPRWIYRSRFTGCSRLFPHTFDPVWLITFTVTVARLRWTDPTFTRRWFRCGCWFVVTPVVDCLHVTDLDVLRLDTLPLPFCVTGCWCVVARWWRFYVCYVTFTTRYTLPLDCRTTRLHCPTFTALLIHVATLRCFRSVPGTTCCRLIPVAGCPVGSHIWFPHAVICTFTVPTFDLRWFDLLVVGRLRCWFPVVVVVRLVVVGCSVPGYGCYVCSLVGCYGYILVTVAVGCRLRLRLCVVVRCWRYVYVDLIWTLICPLLFTLRLVGYVVITTLLPGYDLLRSHSPHLRCCCCCYVWTLITLVVIWRCCCSQRCYSCCSCYRCGCWLTPVVVYVCLRWWFTLVVVDYVTLRWFTRSICWLIGRCSTLVVVAPRCDVDLLFVAGYFVPGCYGWLRLRLFVDLLRLVGFPLRLHLRLVGYTRLLPVTFYVGYVTGYRLRLRLRSFTLLLLLLICVARVWLRFTVALLFTLRYVGLRLLHVVVGYRLDLRCCPGYGYVVVRCRYVTVTRLRYGCYVYGYGYVVVVVTLFTFTLFTVTFVVVTLLHLLLICVICCWLLIWFCVYRWFDLVVTTDLRLRLRCGWLVVVVVIYVGWFTFVTICLRCVVTFIRLICCCCCGWLRLRLILPIYVYGYGRSLVVTVTRSPDGWLRLLPVCYLLLGLVTGYGYGWLRTRSHHTAHGSTHTHVYVYRWFPFYVYYVVVGGCCYGLVGLRLLVTHTLTVGWLVGYGYTFATVTFGWLVTFGLHVTVVATRLRLDFGYTFFTDFHVHTTHVYTVYVTLRIYTFTFARSLPRCGWRSHTPHPVYGCCYVTFICVPTVTVYTRLLPTIYGWLRCAVCCCYVCYTHVYGWFVGCTVTVTFAFTPTRLVTRLLLRLRSTFTVYVHHHTHVWFAVVRSLLRLFTLRSHVRLVVTFRLVCSPHTRLHHHVGYTRSFVTFTLPVTFTFLPVTHVTLRFGYVCVYVYGYGWFPPVTFTVTTRLRLHLRCWILHPRYCTFVHVPHGYVWFTGFHVYRLHTVTVYVWFAVTVTFVYVGLHFGRCYVRLRSFPYGSFTGRLLLLRLRLVWIYRLVTVWFTHVCGYHGYTRYIYHTFCRVYTVVDLRLHYTDRFTLVTHHVYVVVTVTTFTFVTFGYTHVAGCLLRFVWLFTLFVHPRTFRSHTRLRSLHVYTPFTLRTFTLRLRLLRLHLHVCSLVAVTLHTHTRSVVDYRFVVPTRWLLITRCCTFVAVTLVIAPHVYVHVTDTLPLLLTFVTVVVDSVVCLLLLLVVDVVDLRCYVGPIYVRYVVIWTTFTTFTVTRLRCLRYVTGYVTDLLLHVVYYVCWFDYVTFVVPDVVHFDLFVVVVYGRCVVTLFTVLHTFVVTRYILLRCCVVVCVVCYVTFTLFVVDLRLRLLLLLICCCCVTLLLLVVVGRYVCLLPVYVGYVVTRYTVTLRLRLRLFVTFPFTFGWFTFTLLRYGVVTLVAVYVCCPTIYGYVYVDLTFVTFTLILRLLFTPRLLLPFTVTRCWFVTTFPVWLLHVTFSVVYVTFTFTVCYVYVGYVDLLRFAFRSHAVTVLRSTDVVTTFTLVIHTFTFVRYGYVCCYVTLICRLRLFVGRCCRLIYGCCYVGAVVHVVTVVTLLRCYVDYVYVGYTVVTLLLLRFYIPDLLRLRLHYVCYVTFTHGWTFVPVLRYALHDYGSLRLPHVYVYHVTLHVYVYGYVVTATFDLRCYVAPLLIRWLLIYGWLRFVTLLRAFTTFTFVTFPFVYVYVYVYVWLVTFVGRYGLVVTFRLDTLRARYGWLRLQLLLRTHTLHTPVYRSRLPFTRLRYGLDFTHLTRSHLRLFGYILRLRLRYTRLLRFTFTFTHVYTRLVYTHVYAHIYTVWLHVWLRLRYTRLVYTRLRFGCGYAHTFGWTGYHVVRSVTFAVRTHTRWFRLVGSLHVPDAVTHARLRLRFAGRCGWLRLVARLRYDFGFHTFTLVVTLRLHTTHTHVYGWLRTHGYLHGLVTFTFYGWVHVYVTFTVAVWLRLHGWLRLRLLHTTRLRLRYGCDGLLRLVTLFTVGYTVTFTFAVGWFDFTFTVTRLPRCLFPVTFTRLPVGHCAPVGLHVPGCWLPFGCYVLRLPRLRLRLRLVVGCWFTRLVWLRFAVTLDYDHTVYLRWVVPVCRYRLRLVTHYHGLRLRLRLRFTVTFCRLDVYVHILRVTLRLVVATFDFTHRLRLLCHAVTYVYVAVYGCSVAVGWLVGYAFTRLRGCWLRLYLAVYGWWWLRTRLPHGYGCWMRYVLYGCYVALSPHEHTYTRLVDFTVRGPVIYVGLFTRLVGCYVYGCSHGCRYTFGYVYVTRLVVTVWLRVGYTRSLLGWIILHFTHCITYTVVTVTLHGCCYGCYHTVTRFGWLRHTFRCPDSRLHTDAVGHVYGYGWTLRFGAVGLLLGSRSVGYGCRLRLHVVYVYLFGLRWLLDGHPVWLHGCGWLVICWLVGYGYVAVTHTYVAHVWLVYTPRYVRCYTFPHILRLRFTPLHVGRSFGSHDFTPRSPHITFTLRVGWFPFVTGYVWLLRCLIYVGWLVGCYVGYGLRLVTVYVTLLVTFTFTLLVAVVYVPVTRFALVWLRLLRLRFCSFTLLRLVAFTRLRFGLRYHTRLVTLLVTTHVYVCLITWFTGWIYRTFTLPHGYGCTVVYGYGCYGWVTVACYGLFTARLLVAVTHVVTYVARLLRLPLHTTVATVPGYVAPRCSYILVVLPFTHTHGCWLRLRCLRLYGWFGWFPGYAFGFGLRLRLHTVTHLLRHIYGWLHTVTVYTTLLRLRWFTVWLVYVTGYVTHGLILRLRLVTFRLLPVYGYTVGYAFTFTLHVVTPHVWRLHLHLRLFYGSRCWLRWLDTRLVTLLFTHICGYGWLDGYVYVTFTVTVVTVTVAVCWPFGYVYVWLRLRLRTPRLVCSGLLRLRWCGYVARLLPVGHTHIRLLPRFTFVGYGYRTVTHVTHTRSAFPLPGCVCTVYLHTHGLRYPRYVVDCYVGLFVWLVVVVRYHGHGCTVTVTRLLFCYTHTTRFGYTRLPLRFTFILRLRLRLTFTVVGCCYVTLRYVWLDVGYVTHYTRFTGYTHLWTTRLDTHPVWLHSLRLYVGCYGWLVPFPHVVDCRVLLLRYVYARFTLYPFTLPVVTVTVTFTGWLLRLDYTVDVTVTRLRSGLLDVTFPVTVTRLRCWLVGCCCWYGYTTFTVSRLRWLLLLIPALVTHLYVYVGWLRYVWLIYGC